MTDRRDPATINSDYFNSLLPELQKRLDRNNDEKERYFAGGPLEYSSFWKLADTVLLWIRSDYATFVTGGVYRWSLEVIDSYITRFSNNKTATISWIEMIRPQIAKIRRDLELVNESLLNYSEKWHRNAWLKNLTELEEKWDLANSELSKYDEIFKKLNENKTKLVTQQESERAYDAQELKKLSNWKLKRRIILGLLAFGFLIFVINIFNFGESQKTEVVTTAKAPAITTPPAPVVDTNRIQIAGGDIYYLDRNIKQVVDGEVLQMARREKDNQNRLLFKTRVGADYAYKDIGPVYDIVLLENKLGTALKAKPENFSVSVWIVLLNDAKSIHGTFFGNEIERAMRQVSNDPNNPKVREMYVWNGQVNGSNYLPKFLTWAKNEK